MKYTIIFIFALVLSLGFAWIIRAEDEQGESKAALALKNRATAPKDSDMDKAVSIDSMLQAKKESDLAQTKAAKVDAFVVQVEREDDGDYHLALASAEHEPNSTKWVIAEVTPGWQKKDKSLSGPQLKELYGKKVEVSGWLYYEPEENQPDPRGTRWEIHPVTSIVTK